MMIKQWSVGCDRTGWNSSIYLIASWDRQQWGNHLEFQHIGLNCTPLWCSAHIVFLVTLLVPRICYFQWDKCHGMLRRLYNAHESLPEWHFGHESRTHGSSIKRRHLPRWSRCSDSTRLSTWDFIQPRTSQNPKPKLRSELLLFCAAPIGSLYIIFSYSVDHEAEVWDWNARCSSPAKYMNNGWGFRWSTWDCMNGGW